MVPDAAVRVHNTDTGIDRAVTTNGSGIYVAPFLAPGNYKVTISKPGLAKLVRKDLTVGGPDADRRFPMPVQTTQETVTVISDAAVIDTEKTGSIAAHHVRPGRESSARRPKLGTLRAALPGRHRRWRHWSHSYRGISALYNGSSVDGANNEQAFFSETKGRTVTGLPYVYRWIRSRNFRSAPPIQRRVGQAAGGMVNAVTKSGTNAFMATCSITCAIRPERAGSDPESGGYLHPADPSATTVRRQHGRTDYQRQAVLLLDLRWFPQGESRSATPAAPNSRCLARPRSAAPCRRRTII